MEKIVFAPILLFLCQCFADNPTVNTKVGTIIGTRENVTFDNVSKMIDVYLGIPYAEPPTGNLRFAKPIAKHPFSKPFRATNLGPACPQNMFLNTDQTLLNNMREDCLSVNLYVPVRNTTDDTSLSVMIFIHGGGFVLGSSNYFNSSVLSSFNAVIVVTMNYRLSVFGFLSTGNSASPGNYGLWDQHMAIKWVHENIAAFGGNPNSITLFGQSAGSASVYYQATYPGNKGLFKRIIGESGTPLSPFAFAGFSNEWKHNLNYFVNKTGCPFSSSIELVQCLRQLSMEKLMTSLSVQETVIELRYRFSPVTDNDFIRLSPHQILFGHDKGTKAALDIFYSVDVLTGVNNMDGASRVLSAWANVLKHYGGDINKGVPQCIYDSVIIPSITASLFYKNITAVNKAIITEYTNWFAPTDPIITRSELIDLVSDFRFFVPTMVYINKHSNLSCEETKECHKNTHFYQFSVRPSYDQDPTWIAGAVHAAELPFIFGFPDSLARAFGMSSLTANRAEIYLSQIMQTFWTNFAKSGDPNHPIGLDFQWPAYSVATKKYLDFTFNMSKFSVHSHLHGDREAFWEYKIPAILNNSFDKS